MRLSVIAAFFTVSFSIVGCDRAVPPLEQGGEQEKEQAPSEVAPQLEGAGSGEAGGGDNATDAAAAKASAGDIQLKTGDGLTAELTRDYAGQPTPDVAFTGFDGRKLQLSDYSGRPLLVNIWATWCAPCKKEMPALDTLAALEAGRMSVIAISQDLKGRGPVRAFFEKTQIQNLEGFNDRRASISAALAPSLPLPATVLYDSNGVEVWRVIGPVEWDGEDIAALLDEAS